MHDRKPQVFNLEDARRLPLGEPVGEYAPAEPRAVRAFKAADGKTMLVGVNVDGALVRYEQPAQQPAKRKKEVA